MQRKRRVGIGLLAGVFVLLMLPLSASATSYYGCFNCRPRGLTGFGGTCSGAGNGGTGAGTRCDEDSTDLPYPNDVTCATSGNACYETDVTDGGGGLSSGGDVCTKGGPGGFCSAQCFSCGGGLPK